MSFGGILLHFINTVYVNWYSLMPARCQYKGKSTAQLKVRSTKKRRKRKEKINFWIWKSWVDTLKVACFLSQFRYKRTTWRFFCCSVQKRSCKYTDGFYDSSSARVKTILGPWRRWRVRSEIEKESDAFIGGTFQKRGGGWGGGGRGRGFLHMCITNIGQKNLSTNEGLQSNVHKAQVSGSMVGREGGEKRWDRS